MVIEITLSFFVRKLNFKTILENYIRNLLEIEEKMIIYHLSKFRFLTKISTFDQNFHFWPKFRLLTKILIFDQNLDFWPKLSFLTKISIVDQNFDQDFWQKFQSFTENYDFSPKFQFLAYLFFFFCLKFVINFR